ncbi:hypothetical protein ECG_07959 [Echinococcus granulosus]|nr:hypothetical protein ECG_07959 [Echinococcus granulosus]
MQASTCPHEAADVVPLSSMNDISHSMPMPNAVCLTEERWGLANITTSTANTTMTAWRRDVDMVMQVGIGEVGGPLSASGQGARHGVWRLAHCTVSQLKGTLSTSACAISSISLG